MDDNLKELYLNEKEAAAITKDSLSKLRNDRHLSRGLPFIKWGKRSVRYKLSDIIKFMEAGRVDTANRGKNE